MSECFKVDKLSRPVSLARIGGNRGVLAKTEVRRERREHDHSVVSQLLSRDGPLRDLELIGRLYVESTEDGGNVPLFAKGEIAWMEAVGLPVYIEHCYPRGVKLPTGSLLNKHAYTVPSDESIPVGKVTHAYPDAAEGELWVRVAIDNSGLSGEEETSLRKSLQGKLVDMSISFAHSDDISELSDGIGVPFHGGLLDLADGRKARLLEASLTKGGDIPDCHVALVKASRDEDVVMEKDGEELTFQVGDNTLKISYLQGKKSLPMIDTRVLDAGQQSMSTDSVPAQHSEDMEVEQSMTKQISSEQKVGTIIGSELKTPSTTNGEIFTSSQQNQKQILQQAAQGSKINLNKQQAVSYDFQPEKIQKPVPVASTPTNSGFQQRQQQVYSSTPTSSRNSQLINTTTTMSEDIPMEDASGTHPGKQQQQSGSGASDQSSSQQQQQKPAYTAGMIPTGGSAIPPSSSSTNPAPTPASGLTGQQQQSSSSSSQPSSGQQQQKAEWSQSDFESMKSQLENAKFIIPHLGAIASKLGMSSQDAMEFATELSAPRLRQLIESSEKERTTQPTGVPQQQQQQGGIDPRHQQQQQQMRQDQGARGGGSGKSISDQNMEVFMKAASGGGPIGAQSMVDRKRPASSVTAMDEDMEVTGSTSKANRTEYDSSAAGRRAPDFNPRATSGAVGTQMQIPEANDTTIMMRKLEELAKKPEYQRALYTDPAVRATLQLGTAGM